MASWNNRIRARGSARQIRLMARRSSRIRTHDSESQSGTPYWPEGKAPRTSVRNGETVASAPGAARSLTARQVRLKARRSSRIRTQDAAGCEKPHSHSTTARASRVPHIGLKARRRVLRYASQSLNAKMGCPAGSQRRLHSPFGRTAKSLQSLKAKMPAVWLSSGSKVRWPEGQRTFSARS